MNEQLRKAVRAEARKTKAQRKARVAEKIAAAYDNIKTFEFPERNLIHMERHFYFPKIFGPRLFGSILSKAAIAVYPVMCSRANFENNDWFQLPQEAIAKMAGVSINTAHGGIMELVDGNYGLPKGEVEILVPLLETKMTTEGRRHFYLYRVGFVRKDMIPSWRGRHFIFYTCLIDSGIWAELKPRAKALYLAMRCAAVQDFATYCEAEMIETGEVPFCPDTGQDEYYQQRKWDLVNTPMAELGRSIGVSVTDIKTPIRQLAQHRLVEKVDRWYKVYLKPKIR